MTTAKQKTSNRNNSKLSTGPRTPKGKAIVSMNAIKHGLLSRATLLPEDDESAMVELGKRLREHFQPVGELEVLLVDRVISSVWRLRRLLAVEVGITQEKRVNYLGNDEGVGGAFIRASDMYATLSRYEATVERSLYRALHEIQRLQAARSGEFPPLPVVVDIDISTDNGAV